MLARVIRRLKKCKSFDEIIVVTPDFPVVQIADEEGVLWSLSVSPRRDVLAEFYHAARTYTCAELTIVRITGDCPAICPEMVDKIVRVHLENGRDLTCNRNDNLAYCNEIDGLDVEVFDFEALEKAYRYAKEPGEREHVTRWMYDNLKTTIVECGWHFETPNQIKLSVDTPEDYDRMCRIYEALGPDFSMNQLREYIEKEKRNEQA